jgi:hypothetical protein
MWSTYGVILYKNTGLYAIYYLCPHSGHIYLDQRFKTEEEAWKYIEEEL